MTQTTLTDDEIVTLSETMAKSTQLKLYKYWNRSGITMAGIDYAIQQAVKGEKADA